MANPLPNEKELYEKIKKERISLHPVIGELIDHHIGNDVYVISLISGSHVQGEIKEPIPIEDGEKIVNHCEEIRIFLKKIRKATKPK